MCIDNILPMSCSLETLFSEEVSPNEPISSRGDMTLSALMYCTVLYCTVLYCTRHSPLVSLVELVTPDQQHEGGHEGEVVGHQVHQP